MSHLFCALLFEKGRFDASLLDGILADAEPIDEHEAMIQLSLNDRVEAVYYRAPQTPSRSEAYFEGQGWFDEVLTGDLAAVVDEVEGDNTIYAICYEEISDSRFGWVIAPDRYERRAVFAGDGERTYLDDDGEYRTDTADVSVSASDFGLSGDDESEFDEEAYHRARVELEAPFCGLELLTDELGVDLEMLIDGLYRVWEGEGKRIWPAQPGDAHR